ncbi:MAG: hypothetical protein GY793_10145 [Proteobacteria bacterium]|nr:hypothetical protein [Pseudomonadota bacterium]
MTKKTWIVESNNNITTHNSLKSVERENLIHNKTTKDGVKEIKINARLISKSVKEFGYYKDLNYKIYQSLIINNK